jgi:leucyl/phenylalanyl-tRNA--protein transferase
VVAQRAELRRPVTASWLRELVEAYPFPEPLEGSQGLLAWGGDLRPERILAAYAQGVFPWYEREPILWHSPDPRMLLVPEELVVNRSLAKSLRRGRQQVRFDSDFEGVIRGCAEAPRPGQKGTWITPEMTAAFCELHELGFAHSAEAWQEGELVGGVYGVALGAAFFAESMFTRSSDASKVAFVRLVRRLEGWGFHFVDCQVHTEHTARLGAREWPRARFLERLARALEVPTRRGSWRDEADV